MNYGVRSVMNEVKTVAIQILAEAQVRGDIGKKCVAYFIYLSIHPIMYTMSTVGSFIYLLMMLATSTWLRRTQTVNCSIPLLSPCLIKFVIGHIPQRGCRYVF